MAGYFYWKKKRLVGRETLEHTYIKMKGKLEV
jgi:hypothetical protein